MEQSLKHRIKMSGWFGAACALAVMWVLLPSQAPAQTSAGSASTTSKTGTRSGATKAKTAAKSSHTTKSSTTSKAHTASHSSSATHGKSTTTSARSGKSKYAKSRKGGSIKKARGQQKIAPERAQEIQEALVREHYLSEAAGTWDQATEDAMRRYQADHGWQSKTVPDARALIALGLGPSHDHLLNPESAMTTEPESPHATALAPSPQSPDPGASMNPNPASQGTPVQQNSGSPQ